MHSSGSFLRTVLERIRAYLDEVDLDAKYNDDYIVRHTICPCYTDVVSRLNNTIGCPVVNRLAITLTTTDSYYKLPPCVQEVLRLVSVNGDGQVVLDVVPGDRNRPMGPGWALVGNPGAMELYVEATARLGASISMELWYVNNGDMLPALGTGTLDATKKIVTVAASPTLGALERRESAAVGQVLRLLPASPGCIEERLITAYTESAGVWTATVRTAFTKASAGSVTYEIAPAGSQALYEAVACWAAMKLGVGRKITQQHHDRLRQQYLASLKTIGDNLTNIQSRRPQGYVKDTVDNPSMLGMGFLPGR